MSLYDPLSFFEEMGENSILINLEGEGVFKELLLILFFGGGEEVYSDSCYQIVVITYSFLLFFFLPSNLQP